MEIHKRKIGGKTYQLALSAFQKQFNDVVSMKRIYINDENKVYAGEWLDSKGVHNFNSGYAPDVHIQVDFI